MQRRCEHGEPASKRDRIADGPSCIVEQGGPQSERYRELGFGLQHQEVRAMDCTRQRFPLLLYAITRSHRMLDVCSVCCEEVGDTQIKS